MYMPGRERERGREREGKRETRTLEYICGNEDKSKCNEFKYGSKTVNIYIKNTLFHFHTQCLTRIINLSMYTSLS